MISLSTADSALKNVYLDVIKNELNNEIYKLEYSNKLLSKDNDFKKKQINISETFSKSDEYIGIIDEER